MTEPSSDPSRSRRQHARGKSVDMSALGLAAMAADDEHESIDVSSVKRTHAAARAKSMDFRGVDLAELADLAGGLDDGSKTRDLYKKNIRDKGQRKGRIFQSSQGGAPPPPELAHTGDTAGPESNTREAEFNEETKAMEKERDQLEIDIFDLESQLSRLKRQLEEKSKKLKDSQSALVTRQQGWWDNDGSNNGRPRAGFSSSRESSPVLGSSCSPVLPYGSLSPCLMGSVSPAESPFVSPAASAASTPILSPNSIVSCSAASSPSVFATATSSPASCHSMGASPFLPALSCLPAAPSSSSPPLRSSSGPTSLPPLKTSGSCSNLGVQSLFAVPPMTFPSSRATASATPPSPRRSPFSRHLKKNSLTNPTQ